MNNDNGQPMVTVDLDGNGIGRNVAVRPGHRSISATSASALTVRLSAIAPTEVLGVANGDDDRRRSRSRKIDIVGGDGAFEAQALDGTPLPDEPRPRPRAAHHVPVRHRIHARTPRVTSRPNAVAVPRRTDPQATGRSCAVAASTSTPVAAVAARRAAATGSAMVLVMLGARARRGGAAAGSRRALGAHRCEHGACRPDAQPQPDAVRSDAGDRRRHDVPAARRRRRRRAARSAVMRTGDLREPAAAARHVAERRRRGQEPHDAVELGGAYAFGGRSKPACACRSTCRTATRPDDSSADDVRRRPGGTARGDLTLHAKYQLGARRRRRRYGLAAAMTVPTATKDEFAGNEQADRPRACSC